MNVAPIDATDLADWAVRLYDEYLRRPDLIRPATWARLERRPAGHLLDDPERIEDHKLSAIAESQAAGQVRRGDAFDVMAMVIAMSGAWSPVSMFTQRPAQEPPELHQQRRSLLRESVRRAMTADQWNLCPLQPNACQPCAFATARSRLTSRFARFSAAVSGLLRDTCATAHPGRPCRRGTVSAR
ncbi:hypothetical protein GCM10022233_55770 [Streptomyces shaanxiensis]|uniref:HTH-type transcriptional repressor Sco4008 C-terminal domain-containing protein n=1 Tax=Streptomyces shaanxiensis TaxID=653357 RepID=A0ABP7VPJ0_9ACTN